MADLSEGAVFAGHRIEGVAGRGGMGTVYRATHLVLDHVVALKVIAPDLATDDSFRERFKSESRIAVSLRHPNVVPIHHAGEEDGLLFVTMDLIDGPDLRKLLIARGALEPEQAVAILEAVASALDVAHSRGLVHRDIKPGNILIEERGRGGHVYLTDFGLTKRMDQASNATALTSTGAFVGTLDYVAPEQIRGDELDARTDVYALGCVLYEMLAARAPFSDREEKVAKMYAHLQDSPVPLGGENAAFDEVIERAIAKEADDRFPSAGDLARAAAAAVEGRSVETAERSVGVGPAAPTAAHQTPAEPIDRPLLDPTVESEAPAFDDTVPSQTPTPSEIPAQPSDARTRAEEPPTEAVEPPTEATPRRGAPSGPRRSKAPLLAAIGAVIGLVVAGVLLLGGGGDDATNGGGQSTTSSQQGGGEAEPFDPAVLPGGIAGGDLPVGVAAEGDDVYIADRDGAQVIQAKAGDMTEVDRVALGTPAEDVVVSGDSVFVTLPGTSEVAKLSRGLGDLVRIPIGDGAAAPSGITADDDSVWVAGLNDGRVYEIPSDGETAQPFDVGATAPFGIAVNGDIIWVVDRLSNSVIKYDTAADKEVETVGVGANPKGVAIAGGIVYVANTDDGTVTLIDEATAKEIENSPVDVDGQPRAVDVLDDHVWVSNGDDEGDVEVQAGAVMEAGSGWVDVFEAGAEDPDPKKLEVGGSPEGLGVSDGLVWVATGTGGQAKAISPTGEAPQAP